MFDSKEIEKVKAEHPGLKLFGGAISFIDDEHKPVDVEFIYRKPMVVDMEIFNKGVQKAPFEAQSNLLQSLIVHPDPKVVMDKVAGYPPVVANFVDEAIMPFFGSAIKSRSYQI